MLRTRRALIGLSFKSARSSNTLLAAQAERALFVSSADRVFSRCESSRLLASALWRKPSRLDSSRAARVSRAWRRLVKRGAAAPGPASLPVQRAGNPRRTRRRYVDDEAGDRYVGAAARASRRPELATRWGPRLER